MRFWMRLRFATTYQNNEDAYNDKSMKRYYPFLIPAVLFLALKLSSLGIRFSDTNIYFYTAFQILQGKMLYKDIFFTNFPLFIYMSSLYNLLSGNSILFYYFTATLESIVTAFILYLLVIDKTKRRLLATLSAMMYLFSYLILATSDHQSGVFLASFFATLSYYVFSKKKYFYTGIIVACMILTKAYFLPVLIAYLFVLPRTSLKKNSPMLLFMIGGCLTGLIILLPSLLFSFHEFYQDIITYSLVRPQGVSKALIFNALLTREFFLLGLSILSLGYINKFRFTAILSLSMGVLFLFYKDFYFYYFNIAAPFLCLFFVEVYQDIERKFQPQKFFIPTILLIIVIINISQYFATTRDQRIGDINPILTAIKVIHPPFLYGVNDITPLLAFETKTPLLNTIVDTNPTIFRKGFLNNTTLTNDAIKSHALLIGHGVNYPEFNVKQDFIDEIFDQKLLKDCKLVGDFPITTEGYINRLQLVSCP